MKRNIAAVSLALCICAAAPSLAAEEKRWDKKACEIFGHARKADMCTLDAIQGFASLTNEPARLIAEQSVKKCDWAWRYVYDQEGHLGVNFDQYLKSWANQWLVVVLESRTPCWQSSTGDGRAEGHNPYIHREIVKGLRRVEVNLETVLRPPVSTP